jgi:hypothetical protein
VRFGLWWRELLKNRQKERERTALALLFFLFAAAFSSAQDLPPAPKGFSWIRLPEIKGALLSPNGWHFMKEEKQGTIAYFITEQNIKKEGRFQTGLSLNVIPPRKSSPAKEYAAAYIGKVAKENELLQIWDTQAGALAGYGCRVRTKDKSRGPLILHTLMLANTRTNRLYLFVFESPEKEWTAAWKLGEQMMTMLVLDDEV